MRYVITDGGIQFIDEDPPDIPLTDAVKVLQGISRQIEAIGHEPARLTDAAVAVDSAQTP